MYHIGFLEIIKKVLACVGYHTHHLLINKNDEKEVKAIAKIQKDYKGKKRLRAMHELLSKKMYDNNNSIQPRYRREEIWIIVDFSKNKTNAAAKRRNRNNQLDAEGNQSINIQNQEEDLDDEVTGVREEEGKRKFRASEALNILNDLSDEESFECVVHLS